MTNFFYIIIKATFKCTLLALTLTPHPMDKITVILTEDSFKCTFLNGNDRIHIRISLQFVPRSPIGNKPALVRVMACRQAGAKPLLEPMLPSSLTHKYGTRGEMS